VAWVTTFYSALTITPQVAAAVIHPTCATDHLGVSTTAPSDVPLYLPESAAKPVRMQLAADLRATVGFSIQNSPKAATTEEAQEVQSHTYDAYLCSNRTCEVGMSAAHRTNRINRLSFCSKK